MANFVQEKYNSMPEQVEENKKNIKELINYIKPVYKSLIALTIATTSIAIASTNAPDETTSGWIIDENGLLFHITSGDGTNLLINYYATLKGEKGDTGETGATGADGQDGARGYSIHYASVDFDENTTTYNLSDISQNAPVVADDLVLFKNGYLVLIYSVSATTITTANGTAILLEIGGSASNYICYITPYYDAQEEIYRLPLSDILDTKDDEEPVDSSKLQNGDIIICLNQISQIQGYYLYSGNDTTEAFFYNKLEIPFNIPTINLEQSQMTDQTHVQFNQTQYSLIRNNGVINIVLPTNLKYTFIVNNIMGTYTLTITKGTSTELTFMTITIDSQTLIGTISGGDMQAGKKYYQHNIYIQSGGSYDYTLTIFDDNNEAITNSNFNERLLPFINKNLIVSGWQVISSTQKPITRAKFILEAGVYKIQLFSSINESINWGSHNVYEDGVIEL